MQRYTHKLSYSLLVLIYVPFVLSFVTQKYLAANAFYLKTSNAPIEGTFNSTGSIEFRTSNAPVGVQVSLTNDGSHGKINRLVMQTSNR